MSDAGSIDSAPPMPSLNEYQSIVETSLSRLEHLREGL